MKQDRRIKLSKRLPNKVDWYFVLDKDGNKEIGYWDGITWHVWGWYNNDIEYWLEEIEITEEDIEMGIWQICSNLNDNHIGTDTATVQIAAAILSKLKGE